MGIQRICKKENDAVLDLKVRMMNRCQELGREGDKSACQELMRVFDCLPSIEINNQVKVKCGECIYPNCKTAKTLSEACQLFEKRQLTRLPMIFERIGYQSATA